MRIPRNRAVIMLVIDVSQSMRATDVDPNRLKAAQQAASQFARQLTPGINGPPSLAARRDRCGTRADRPRIVSDGTQSPRLSDRLAGAHREDP
jgi:hypothetical protein